MLAVTDCQNAWKGLAVLRNRFYSAAKIEFEARTWGKCSQLQLWYEVGVESGCPHYETCNTHKVVKWTETMLSKLATLLYIYSLSRYKLHRTIRSKGCKRLPCSKNEMIIEISGNFIRVGVGVRGGVDGRGVHPPRHTPTRRPLKRAVRVLLECILEPEKVSVATNFVSFDRALKRLNGIEVRKKYGIHTYHFYSTSVV